MPHKFQRETKIKELADVCAALMPYLAISTGNYRLLRGDVSRCTSAMVDPFSLISVIEEGEAGDGLSLNFKARRVSLTKLRESEFAVSNPSPFRD